MQPMQIKKGGKKEMWKRKKFIIPLVVAGVLAGSLAGAAFAQEGDEVGPPPGGTLIERLAEKLGIEQSEIETAFAEVRSEMRNSRLQELVEQGRLTQEEADQFNEWWQARPEMELAGLCARLGGPGGHLGSAFGPRGQGGPGSLGGPGGCWGANPTS